MAVAACGGDDEQAADRQRDGTEQPRTSAPQTAPPTEPGEGPADEPPDSEADTDPVGATATAWIEAIDARDGARICGLTLEGALEDLRVRGRETAGCPERLEASLGRARGEGLPQWEGTRITAVRTEETGDGEARATISVVHEFADRENPSVEDDIVYLQRTGDRWRVAQPSATLYRAVGYPEPPLAAITPPGE